MRFFRWIVAKLRRVFYGEGETHQRLMSAIERSERVRCKARDVCEAVGSERP